MLVVGLDEVRRADAPRVGGKSAALGTLREAGFPVPDAVCVTTAAFHLAMEPYRARLAEILSSSNLADPGECASAATAIADLLADLTVPQEVAEQVRAALPPLGAGPLAVRSSATAEDARQISFAGEYETVLGAVGEAAVLDALVTCWRSFYAPGALAARAAVGLAEDGEGMACLVQRMVAAECAGVCFTMDPVQGRADSQVRADRMVIDAAWGLGAGAADGSVWTDVLWIRRDDLGVDDRRIVEQPDQLVLAADGRVVRVPVPADRVRSACLPDTWVRRLVTFGFALENLLGHPQDFEWVIADGQVWILQSRPITTLPAEIATLPPFPVAWESDEDRRSEWTLDVYAHRRVLEPLEADMWDVWTLANADSYAFRGNLQKPVRKWFNGRPYLTNRPTGLHDGDRRIRVAGHNLRTRWLRDQGLTLWDYWLPEILADNERLQTFDRESADGPALAAHLEDAFGALRWHWGIHWLKSSEEHDGPFKAAYARATGLPPHRIAEGVAFLVQGEESALTRMMDGLYDLSRAAVATPSVAAFVREVAAGDEDESAPERIAALPEGEAFRARLEQFMRDFGMEMGMGWGSPVTIRQHTWRENPAAVLRLVAPYLDGPAISPSVGRARARAERDARFEAICAAATDREAVEELRRWLPYVRRVEIEQEGHHFHLDNCAYGQVRTAIVAAGRWLTRQGAIADAEDVFLLQFDEALTLLRSPNPASVQPLVEERRARNAALSCLAPPPVLGAPRAALPPRPPFADDVTAVAAEAERRLVGVSASPGRARGRARVVSANALLPVLEPGEILVSEAAYPAWSPAVPVLGGMVLDAGGLLQHTMTTAREYAVPAVIRTQVASRRIPEGAWVTVDGDTGIVEWEE